MVREGSAGIRIIEIILALALVGGLWFAGWRIYSRLPDDPAINLNVAGNGNRVGLTIVLASDLLSKGRSAGIELYPVDVGALERQFGATPHPGKQFEDFFALRLRDITPVRLTTNEQGRASAEVGLGNWWLHAKTSLNGGESLEWRLPLNVSSVQQTVELTRENAYERTKKF